MANTNTIQDIRKRCRIVTDTFDAEIGSNIDACVIDLGRVGITAISDTDAMILQLYTLYCKAALNFEGEGDKLRVSSASKDALQSVIAMLREKDYGQPLQFTNYR